MASRSGRSSTGASRWLAGTCACLAVWGAVPCTQGGDIRWAAGEFKGAPKEVAAMRAVLDVAKSNASAKHVVVQFERPISEVSREELSRAGLDVLSYLDGYSFYASVADDADIDSLLAKSALVNVEPIRIEWKLDKMLLDGDLPDWAIVGGVEEGDPILGVYVLFHRDVDIDSEGVPIVEFFGGDVRDYIRTVNGVVAEIAASALPALALNDRVQYIEKALPQFSETNAENRVITQANIVQAAPYGLDGSGVNVLVYDGGTARATHVDFQGRLFVRDTSGMINHATHVAGTVGGGGVQNANNRGMAPGVTIQSYGFQYSGGGTFLYTNPGDIEADYDQAINVHGVTISNNSIGTNTATNGFNCAITGDYGVTDAVIDSIVRGSLGQPFRVVWANGNERQSTRCTSSDSYPGEYHSTAPPGCAKNHITVGALNANDDSMTSFSSWGPADDGRLKPDISAPGCQSNGDGGVTSTGSSSNTAYSTLCGTSMAAPTVTGLAALMLQDYRTMFGSPDPRNSTLKILLAHTATDRGNPGPDYQFGYGSVRVQNAIDFMRTGNFFEDEVGQAATYSIQVQVPPGRPNLKVTLAWDDAPAAPGVAVALVNDLDLRVYDPSNNRYYPWTLDGQNPAANAVRTQEDHINNIEQVLVDNPSAGTWRIEVFGFNVPEGPQPFSLCASENLLFPPSVQISLPEGIPAVLAPNTPADVTVRIRTINDALSGTPAMHFRYDGGAYLVTPLAPLGGELYRGTLPPAVCGATPEVFFSATGAVSGPTQNPGTGVYSVVIGSTSTVLSDTAEVDAGWVVGAPGDTATTGIWNRMDPEPTIAQPGDDVTPAPGVNCWVTDGRAGSSDGAFDVDGGATTLTSPAMDLSAHPEARISYWRWYSNSAGGGPNADVFRIQISNNNGGSWTAVETIGPSGPGTSGGWIRYEFRVADIIPPTAQIRLRFIAEDAGVGSLIEAAIDDIYVTSFGCTEPLTDCNENGIVDSADIANGWSADVNSNGIPDECESVAVPGDMNCDGIVSPSDIAGFVLALTDPAEYAAQFPDCNALNGDINDDGLVTPSDIAGFVALLTGP